MRVQMNYWCSHQKTRLCRSLSSVSFNYLTFLFEDTVNLFVITIKISSSDDIVMKLLSQTLKEFGLQV